MSCWTVTRRVIFQAIDPAAEESGVPPAKRSVQVVLSMDAPGFWITSVFVEREHFRHLWLRSLRQWLSRIRRSIMNCYPQSAWILAGGAYRLGFTFPKSQTDHAAAAASSKSSASTPVASKTRLCCCGWRRSSISLIFGAMAQAQSSAGCSQSSFRFGGWHPNQARACSRRGLPMRPALRIQTRQPVRLRYTAHRRGSPFSWLSISADSQVGSPPPTAIAETTLLQLQLIARPIHDHRSV